LKLPISILNISKYAILSVGCLLFVISIVSIILKIKNKNKSNEQSSEEQQQQQHDWISNETTPLLLN
jgi:hypothetical protein